MPRTETACAHVPHFCWQEGWSAGQAPPERRLTWYFVERTTRFELATLTLATCPANCTDPLTRAFGVPP
jgi:hypothetical protein